MELDFGTLDGCVVDGRVGCARGAPGTSRPTLLASLRLLIGVYIGVPFDFLARAWTTGGKGGSTWSLLFLRGVRGPVTGIELPAMLPTSLL